MDEKIQEDDIIKYIRKFENESESIYSFDFCYNYFYRAYKANELKELANTKNIEMSCLQLGFYLASWGMMRGSFLRKNSVKIFENLIVEIPEMEDEFQLWKIDLDNYNDKNINSLLECRERIIKILDINLKYPDTLVTKIMLGVFANIPAYDQYFRIGLKIWDPVNKTSLTSIKKFYDAHNGTFDSIQKQTHTREFSKCEETVIPYKKAKLVDMYGWEYGKKLVEAKMRSIR